MWAKLLDKWNKLKERNLFRTLTSWEEYLAHRESAGLPQRERIDNNIIPSAGWEPFQVEGFCFPCGETRHFTVSYFLGQTHQYPDGKGLPCWREELVCPHCGMNNRMRASLHLFERFLKHDKDAPLYITEAVTPTFRWCKARYANVIGSEFLGGDFAPGQIVNGIRHEDLTKLSFADASVGSVLSFDVLEHIADYMEALREIFRVLAPGGLLLLSVPQVVDSPDHLVKAEMTSDGTIVHHEPPEYHGNPVDLENGALCYRYFGWKLLDDLRKTGFTDVCVKAYWSDKFGYFGRENYFFVARKR